MESLMLNSNRYSFDKQQARHFAKNIHRSVGKSLIKTWDQLICDQLLKRLNLLRLQTCIGWYYPINNIEPNILPLLQKLLSDNFRQFRNALVCIESGELIYRQYNHHTNLVESYKGLLQPDKHSSALIPELLIIPALGLNPQGYRLGWGKGFFDRYTASNSCQTLGIAFPWQQNLNFPPSKFDLKCHQILPQI